MKQNRGTTNILGGSPWSGVLESNWSCSNGP